MGAQTSFFSSEGAPFDVLSEAFGALPSQSEASVGISCHRRLNHGPVLWSFIKKGMEWRKPGEAPPRNTKFTQSTKKITATIFWDCRVILLIEHHSECCILCFTFAQITRHYQEKARNVVPCSSSAPRERSSPHGGCCQGRSEGMWLQGDRTTLQPTSGTQRLLPLLQTK